MDTETKSVFNTTMSIADKIDKHIMKNSKSAVNVKELLRMDLRDFLIFLTIADRIVAKDEIRYINKSLGYTFDSDTMKSFAMSSQMIRDDFLNQPPPSLRYFLDYGKNDFDKFGFSLVTIRNGNRAMASKYPKVYAEKLLYLGKALLLVSVVVLKLRIFQFQNFLWI